MYEPTDYEMLGHVLADIIDQMESQRLFTGDIEGTFTIPLDDGSEYECTLQWKEASDGL